MIKKFCDRCEIEDPFVEELVIRFRGHEDKKDICRDCLKELYK